MKKRKTGVSNFVVKALVGSIAGMYIGRHYGIVAYDHSGKIIMSIPCTTAGALLGIFAATKA